jgi:DNA-directed RNA polymerase specialized sigma24 family protein
MDSHCDRSPFDEFFRRHRSWSRTLMKHILDGTSIDWEVQWIDAWSKFHQNYCDPNFVFRADPKAYLRGCLVNEAKSALHVYLSNGEPMLLSMQDELLDHVTWPLRNHAADLAQPDEPASAALTESSHASAVAAALSRLSPMQRAVIVFWSWREPPPTDREIGEEFGISTSSAKTHRRRALENLRRSLSAASVDSPER